jgi:DhnA family fructose-bisphosphate aldolase class Ia
VNEQQRRLLTDTRFRRPEAIAAAAQARRRRPVVGENGRLLIVAADHPARGSIDLEPGDGAMADRFDLLDRLLAALSVRTVDGVLATPDVVEDLLLLGALDDKLVFGSMNRGGIPGSAFEIDDRFTAYSPEAIRDQGLDGGKMLLRIALDEPATAVTLEAAGAAVSRLAANRKVAMIEPFMAQHSGGQMRNLLSVEAVVRSMAIAAGLGATSAYTWLKVPVLEQMDQVVNAATTPLLLLGGERKLDTDEMFARWEKALALPGVYGLVVGRNLLYPPGGDVVEAVSRAAALL